MEASEQHIWDKIIGTKFHPVVIFHNLKHLTNVLLFGRIIKFQKEVTVLYFKQAFICKNTFGYFKVTLNHTNNIIKA